MPTNENDRVLTPIALAWLVELHNGVGRKSHVTWAVHGNVDVIAEGTLRAFCQNDGGAFMKGDQDVRDAYVWISAGMEHFIPVKDIMALQAEGLFAIRVGT